MLTGLLGYEISYTDLDRLDLFSELIYIPKDRKSQERVVGIFEYYSQWIWYYPDKIWSLVGNQAFPLSDKIAASYKPLEDGATVIRCGNIRSKITFHSWYGRFGCCNHHRP